MESPRGADSQCKYRYSTPHKRSSLRDGPSLARCTPASAEHSNSHMCFHTTLPYRPGSYRRTDTDFHEKSTTASFSGSQQCLRSTGSNWVMYVKGGPLMYRTGYCLSSLPPLLGWPSKVGSYISVLHMASSIHHPAFSAGLAGCA